MLFRVLIFLAAAAVAFADAPVDPWVAVPQTATTNNLWSVAYGAGTLIAVGEQGTIVRYTYAGQAWDGVPSGTSVWLAGVGYGDGRFVVVGDRGTILTSDDGGVTWTSRVSGTTIRLNAAAYGGGHWIVVGEQGTVLGSTDGTTWTALPALGTGFLRGLAYGQGMFLVGGAGGGFWSSSDGITFTAVPIGITQDIEGIAISPTRLWISGSGGLRATATQLNQWVFASDVNTLTYRGAAARTIEEAVFVADAGAAEYVSGSWNTVYPPPAFLATAVTQGQNEMIAVGFNGGIARAGINAGPVIVGDSNTHVYGSDVTLTVVGALPGGTTLQWYHNGALISGATGTTLVLRHVTTADIGGYEIRLTPDPHVLIPLFMLTVVPAGRPELIDPSFVSALPIAPSGFVVQNDGKLIVVGSFSVTLPAGVTYGLARLNSDGSLDASFNPGTGISPLCSVYAVHLLPDGRMYVRGTFTSIAGAARAGLARLNSDGSLDPSFNPTDSRITAPDASALSGSGQLYVQKGSVYRLTVDGGVDPSFVPTDGTLVTIDPRGRLYVDSRSLLKRYLPDGSLDSSFSPWAHGMYFPITGMSTDFGLYVAGYTQTKVFGIVSFHRLNAIGGVDLSYSVPDEGNAAVPALSSAWQPDGGLWELQYAPPGTIRFRAVRYSATGMVDPTSYATMADGSNYAIRPMEADGSMYVTSHLELSFDRRSLVRVRPLTGQVGRLSNLSVRAFVSSEPLIAGVVTTGSGNTTALFRAVGPGLVNYGITDPLTDPQLNLVRDGVTVAINDNWDASLAARFAPVGAFTLPSGSKDAALETTVTPGAYTAVLSPKTGDAGTALVELYQSSDPRTATARMVNVSARGSIDAVHPLIVGFAITGDLPLTVLIRGGGPALGVAPFNLPNVLPDPTITLYRGSTALWDSSTNDSTATWTAAQVAAFPFPYGSKDSAAVVTLAPGSYTAVISSAGQHSGTALAEIYEVGP